MPLVCTGIKSEVQEDTHGNKSYFASFDGVAKDVLVKHKGDKPLLYVGADAMSDQFGFSHVEELTAKSSGNKYLKLMRPAQEGFSSNGSGSTGGTSDPDRQRSIVIQTCTKAAAELGAALASPGMDKNALLAWVMQAADALASHCEDFAKPTPAPSAPQPASVPSYADPDQTDVPLNPDDQIPFRNRPPRDRETRRRDLFVGDRA